jgi:hypothetical protein
MINSKRNSTRAARTREEWLKWAVRELRPLFATAGLEVPKDLRVSVGFGPTGAVRENAKILGVCCARVLSTTKVNEIFISPEDATAETMLATLVHEIIHAIDDCQSGHRGAFKTMALAMGLEGKMTATVAGEDLALDMKHLATVLGPYPGSEMDLAPLKGSRDGGPITSGPKKQGTRMIKRTCQHDPAAGCFGYSVRTTATWLEVGNPQCPNGHEMMA